jgi:bacterioferritin-associated ferredoxin
MNTFDLPMDTKNRDCTCGGPAKFVATSCPECGAQGMRVRAGTVKYLLHIMAREKAVDRIYGLCLTPDCSVSWYAQDGSHSFSVDDTDTPIWTKAGAEPVYACYCNEITRQMVIDAVEKKGLRTLEEIVAHYKGKTQTACAMKNPSGKCCEETFNAMITEALTNYLGCSK